jgi:hypothetical protein
MPSSLTREQRAFLKAVREKGLLLPEVLQESGVPTRLLMRWFRRRYFRKALRQASGELRRRGLLELELLAAAAVATMSAMKGQKIPLDRDLLALCIAIRDDYFRWKRRGARSKRRIIEPPEDLCHPNAKHREKELLAILANDD